MDACPPPGYLPGPRIEPAPLLSPALADRFFTPSATCEAPGETWCGLHETTREPPGAQGEQEEGGTTLPVRHSLLASTLLCRESWRTGDGWPRKQPQTWSGGGLPSLRSAATRVPRDPLVVFSIGAKHRDKERTPAQEATCDGHGLCLCSEGPWAECTCEHTSTHVHTDTHTQSWGSSYTQIHPRSLRPFLASAQPGFSTSC